MKKLLLFIILLSVYSFGQENRTVRQNDMRDTLNANSRNWVNESDLTDSLGIVGASLAQKASLTITDSLAEDIANIADSNFVLTSEIVTGTDSIHYGQDSIVVSHGVGSTPQFVVIQLISDGFGFSIWVNQYSIGSTTFAVKRSDVGLETIDSYIKFKWMAYK